MFSYYPEIAMKISRWRVLLIAGAGLCGLLLAIWMISSAGLILQGIVEASRDLLARHKELLKFYGEIIK